jgi:HEAT repeat protein
VSVLLTAFNDQDLQLSWEAAKSLALLKSKRALRPLIAALYGDGDQNRRQAAAYALGWLGDKRAVEALIDALSDAGEAAAVRGQAAESLGNLRDTRALSPLIAALKDESVEVRFWSAFALGQLGNQKALPALRRLARSDKAFLRGWWEVRKEASDAIERIVQST